MKIKLRKVKVSDAENLFLCETDKEARINFMSSPKSVNEVREGIKKRSKDEETLIIEFNGRFCGSVNVHDLVKGHKGTISICLDKKFRGVGIGTEAIKQFTSYLFKKYKLKRIVGVCRTFNKGSAFALEKAGYKLEGILRKNKLKDGKYLDDMVWAMVR